MSITERYPTFPGNVPTNVTRYPPLRGNGNGDVREMVGEEKHYPTDGDHEGECPC